VGATTPPPLAASAGPGRRVAIQTLKKEKKKFKENTAQHPVRARTEATPFAPPSLAPANVSGHNEGGRTLGANNNLRAS